MQIKIITPNHILFEGEIKLAQFPGEEGSFEILQDHAPLVALLQEGIIRLIDNSNQTLRFGIKDGFVEVANNTILVLGNGKEI